MTPAENAYRLAKRVWWLTFVAGAWGLLSVTLTIALVLTMTSGERLSGHGIMHLALLAISISGIGLSARLGYGLPSALRSQIGETEDALQVVLFKDEKLQESEARSRAVFDQTFQLLGLLTPEGVVKQVNCAAVDFAGVAEDQLVGKFFWDTPYWSHSPELRAKAKDAVQQASQGVAIRFETSALHHAGKTHRFDFSLKPIFDESGKVCYLIPEYHDITELKQSQEALSELFRTIHLQKEALDSAAGVSITDADGRITYVNKKFCDMSGYAEDDFLGRTHRVTSSDIHSTAYWKQMWDCLQAGQLWYGEICNRSQKGELYWVATTIMPARDDEGRICQFIAIHADITERIITEQRLQESVLENTQSRMLLEQYTTQLLKQNEELEEAQAKAETANATKSEFLANMSHEIRTPMTSILGFAELLSEDQDGELPPRQRQEYVETIKRHGEHLLTIINDILDLSKIEAGKMTIEQVPTNVTTIIHEVADLLRVRAQGKAIGLHVVFATGLPQTIQTDPTRLRQILLNLAGNAIKFTETGSVTITAGLDVSRAGHALISISVKDTGIGLTRDQQKSLFGAFQQADNSMTRRFGGTGLGLQISKRLAKMLQGDIQVVSEFGQGSEFTLHLDVRDVSGVPLIAPPSKTSQSSPTKPVGPTTQHATITPILTNMRILLAEDGPDNQRLIAFILRKAGAEVTVADNGKLAVEKLTVDGTIHGELLEPPPFDLILSDMAMPELDGYEATKLLREKGCLLPIIALTAHSMAGDREKCLEAGCNSYASKPIDKVALLKTISEALHQPTRQCLSISAAVMT